MNQSLMKPGNSSSHPFEKWPDEDMQSYKLFMEYCKASPALLPGDYLQAAGHPEVIPEAVIRGWIRRRDTFYRWMDYQRRQQAIAGVQSLLDQITKRKIPHLLKQEEKLMAEADGLPEKELDKRAKLQAKVAKDTNDTLTTLLKIIKVLEPTEGINIQNVINTAPVNKITEMQKSWGAPEPIDPAEET